MRLSRATHTHAARADRHPSVRRPVGEFVGAAFYARRRRRGAGPRLRSGDAHAAVLGRCAGAVRRRRGPELAPVAECDRQCGRVEAGDGAAAE